MKKKIIIVIIVLISILGILGLYQTFALSGTITTSDLFYNVTATNGTTVTVPANSSKTVYYKLTNTNNGTVKYGIGYRGTNITVYYYTDTADPVTGTVDYGKSKFIKLYVQNSGTTSSTATLSTILGYENGGDLIVPSGVTLVTEKKSPLSSYITNLYNNSTTTSVVNNNVTYQYDTTHSLMKDIGNNIRYYGASPNNYIYFNCSDYSNQSTSTCETWRIIGVFDGKIKLIRNESIGSIPFDSDYEDTYLQSLGNSNEEMVASLLTYNLDDKEKVIKLAGEVTVDCIGANDYSKSSLQKILNNYYYKGLKYSGNAVYDFNSIGIKSDITRNMINEESWPLFSPSGGYADQAYLDERVTGNIYSGNPSSWTGKIALAYVSDYGYAADFSKCSQTLVKYDDSTCTSNNWMKSILGISNNSWLLTSSNANSKLIWYVYSTGLVNFGGYINECPSDSSNIIPTFYLNPDVQIKSGNGSSSNPYQILVD